MVSKKLLLVIFIFACVSLVVAATALAQPDPDPVLLAELGGKLYFDTNLSEPDGQACASCHEPAFGFVDPDSHLPVSEGVIPGLFGGRNSPMSAYAMYAPILHYFDDDDDDEEGLWIGGQFWDGRATGETLGDPLADQALGPFLNPVEMANPDEKSVIEDIVESDYYTEWFEPVCGAVDLTNDDSIYAAYDCVALSIAAFERTDLFAPFTSKYDAYLQDCLYLSGGDMDNCAKGIGTEALEAGEIFSKKEWQGLQLFMGENDNDGILLAGEGAMCSACHVADWISDPGNVVVPDWAPEDIDGVAYIPPVFTDFTFDNLGVPKSTHPLLRNNPIDLGLGAVVCGFDENDLQVCDPNLNETDEAGDDIDEYGKFKVMPLRNIAETGPYAHNGYFRTLSKITNFYNTRDVKNWPAPEYGVTMNTEELGNLGLKGSDEAALVAFMETLSDGYSR